MVWTRIFLKELVQIEMEEKCLCTICSVWSKTTLITGSVGGTGEDPPTCKMGVFFLMPLRLTEPSLNNFQLNGAKMF